MALKALCDKCKLPPSVADSLIQLGYDEPELFGSCFVDVQAFESWLGPAREKLGEETVAIDQDDWLTHPIAGKLRLVWKKCQTAACVVPPTVSPATDTGHPLSLSLFGDVSGVHSSSTRLSEADREGLVKKFEKKFTGVALCPSLLPALSLLQIVSSQCKAKSWAWIPWQRILSEELSLDVQSRRSHKRRDMSEIVAEAAGLCGEEWDQEMSGSPHKISTLLSVRANAYAMASGGHLNSWMAYVHKFMFYYTKRPGAGMRPPTPAEAEEADRECLSEIFRMAYHDDVSLDDAIQSVVREDLLRTKLMAQPKPLKAPNGGVPQLPHETTGKLATGKRTKGGRESAEGRKRYKKGLCYGFQEGKCTKSEKDCRFWHRCDKCGASDHGAADCKA